MSVADELKKLNFHDSCFRALLVAFPGVSGRSAIVDIDYYDWEGNAEKRKTEPNAPWRWKRLQISFGFLAQMEFQTPDLINRAQDIEKAEISYDLERFEQEYVRLKRSFPHSPSTRFDGEVVSVRFMTQNHDDAWENAGYLWVVGSDVSLDWLEEGRIEGQIHFPLAGA